MTVRVRTALSYKPRVTVLFSVILAAVAIGGCGKGEDDAKFGAETSPETKGEQRRLAEAKGSNSPSSSLAKSTATVNTTRLGGKDPLATAAQIALTAYPSRGGSQRPPAVVLVDASQWQTTLAASRLANDPLNAPLLFSRGKELPAVSRETLKVLKPSGVKDVKPSAIRGVRVIRVGNSPSYGKLKTTHIRGETPAETAQATDRFVTRIKGKPSNTVLIVSSEQARYAVPAAGWAAKSGDAVLFATRDELPEATRRAIQTRKRPRIYVLGPPNAVSFEVERQLQQLGKTVRIQGKSPVENAIAFARFRDNYFGWGVTDPGHGLTFVNSRRPLDATAAALLSTNGKYAPLLVVDSPTRLSPALADYLRDIKPGYEDDPVRAFYNHGWIVGDPTAISLSQQAQIDSLLEIAQVDYDQNP